MHVYGDGRRRNGAQDPAETPFERKRRCGSPCGIECGAAMTRMTTDEVCHEFDILGELVYVADVETYELLYLSELAEKALTGPWRGRKCHEAIMNSSEPCDFCTNGLLKRDEYYAWTRYNENLGRYFALKDKLIDWDGRPARLEIAFDMSEHREQLLGLERELGLERLLIKCIREMRDIDGFAGDMSSVLRMIGEAMGADRAYIFQVTRSLEGEDTFNNTHEWCAPGIQPEIDELQNMDMSIVEHWISPFSNRETLVIGDIETIRDSQPNEYALLKPQGIRSIVNAPLVAEGELIGSIGVDNPQSIDIERTREFFVNLAYFLSMELEGFRAKERLKAMGYTDALTGLANRNRFTADIEELDEAGPRRGFGVAFIDMNGLKEINDEQGHMRGDRALRAVARIVRSSFPEANVYRLGGDEFLAIQLDVEGDRFAADAARARELFGEQGCSTAMGLFYASEPLLVEQAVKVSDQRMYREKRIYYETHPGADRRGAIL